MDFEELKDSEELTAFDENQREAILTLLRRTRESVMEEVHGKDEQLISDVGNELQVKDQKKLRKAIELWKNNGRIPGRSDRVSYEELCRVDQEWTSQCRTSDSFSTDHPLLIPRVISEVVKEAVEPNIVLTNLLQRINYSAGTHLTFPATGAITAADIPEGGEYPERSLDFAGQVVATIGKSGVAVKMTEEMIRYSLYDVMSMHLRAAGRALIRHKEQKVANMILSNAGGANTIFDNTSASYPSTNGRDGAGAYNGTLTLDDLHKAFATMVNRGFTPNVLIMNPFAWTIFADEAIARAFGFQNGGALWGLLAGLPGNAPQWSNGGFGNGLLQNTNVTDPQNLATTFTNVPSIFPYPFRIIVSPYMPYDEANNRTDIVIADINELGVLVVDEEVTTESWNDPARDIQKVKLRERYGLGSMNEGKGTGLIKGVSLARGFSFAQNVRLTLSGVDLSTDETHTGTV
ncbi:MAG: hypothetical protein D6710_08250 [Nitrospirae bacterium]|nr:MAG: hypothetical protein D6710_08250 [Nitrospirota bacterium]